MTDQWPDTACLPYSQTGGHIIGWSWLFAFRVGPPTTTITVMPDAIELRWHWNKWRIQRECVERVEYYVGPLGWGLRILHHQPHLSSYIVFLVSPEENMRPLEQALKLARIEVQHPKFD